MRIIRLNRSFNLLLAITFSTFLALVPAVCVSADTTQPEEFYGDVTINAAPAPVGTVITATIGNIERGRFTTTETGKYGGTATFGTRLIVAGQQSDTGQPLSFYVNGNKAPQTVMFSPGQSVQLALSAWAYPLSVSDIPVTKALTYLRQAQQANGSIGGFVASSWAVIAIAAAGQDPHGWTVAGNSVVAYMRDNAAVNLDVNKATDWERSVLAIVAAGENPRAFGGIDYIAKLLGFYDGNQIGDPALLNDDFWGIPALISVGEGQQIVPNSVAFIKSKQNADGGWGWAVGGASDADNTAAAVSALIAAGEPAGSQIISKALGYIKTQQQNNGGFLSEGNTNAGGDAWVIRAIRDAGQSPVSSDWQQASTTSLGHLLSLQDTDGAFKWTAALRSNPEWMTAYAVPALLGKPYPKDLVAPVLSGLTPSSGARVSVSNPAVSAGYTDAVSGINTGTARLWLDGSNVTSGATVTATGLSYTANGLSAGTHTARADVSDKVGNPASTTWTFNVVLADTTGGGGAAPPAATSIPLPAGTTSLSGIINSNGLLLQGTVARSDDALCTLNLNQGTKALQSNGQAISQLTAAKMTSPPAPPAAATIIGPAYDFGPAGATFDPPATLAFSFNPLQLPIGASPTIAWWDGNQWVPRDSTIDTEAGTISAAIEHFTSFAVLARQSVPRFDVSALSVIPAKAGIKENVTVSVIVTNSGDAPGSYDVPLNVDNVLLENKTITLAPNGIQTVNFTLSRDTAGIHTVNIGNLSATFEVKAPGGLILKSLTASPAEIYAGGSVVINVSVSNTGDTSISQTLTLKLNDAEVESKQIAMSPGVSDAITFTRMMEKPGTYTASVGALSLTFTVKPAMALPATSVMDSARSFVTANPWLGWGGIAAGGLLILLILFAIIRWIRRRNYYY